MKTTLNNERLNINKTIFTVTGLNIVQVIIILIIIFRKYFYGTHTKTIADLMKNDMIFFIIIPILCLNIFFFIKDFHSFFQQNLKYINIQATLEHMENLNNTLRGQRHDFINHLQVIYSLIEMDEYDEAKDYIDKVFNDIQKVSKVLKTSNPAVNALLQAKIIYGEKRGINTELYIKSRLDNLKIPSWEFCRVLGNIIDNAIYSLQETGGDRVIQIELFEDLKIYGFKISNNGPAISKEVIQHIFDAGFTTKGEKGEGMGLAISKQTLIEYGGDISVESYENKTIFNGWVSK